MAPARAGLGTFSGVFTPSILTILGIVLFLRLGVVVGSSGLIGALIVIAVANAISLLTSLSVAAVATNLRVKAGGDYYLISRTLGPGFGGAIGLVLFFAQAVSIGFYCIGFAEAVSPLLDLKHPQAVHAIALVALIALGSLAWLGADLATRFQYVVMVLLVLGIASFLWGAVRLWDGGTLAANWSAPRAALPFWTAFAIFFPAVTGFTQGVSMSGDLAQPSKSIPRGVLWAVAVSAVVYFAAALLFAAVLPAAELQRDTSAMKRVAVVGLLVDLGVVAATLSSALASFMGAPRILQALAADQVFPWLKRFALGAGPSNNPRAALIPTFVVAAAVVALGNLDLVAPVVSMFFLVSYGLLNYATYYEARSGSPSFRPTFKWFDQRVALVGAVGCLGAMLAIDVVAGGIAVFVVLALYRYILRGEGPARWTDGRRAWHLQRARDHLLAADAEPIHARSWRPQLLVFSDSERRRGLVLRFAHWIEGGAGLTTLVRLVVSDTAHSVARHRDETLELAQEIKAAGSKAFALVVVGRDMAQMASAVVQAAGVGPLRANTVVANWPEGDAAFYAPLGLNSFGNAVATGFRIGTNLVLLDATAAEWEQLQKVPSSERVIDAWWRDNQTGELILLLAYLMTRSSEWRSARIRLLAAPSRGETLAQTEAKLVARLEGVRIPAETVVVPDLEEATVIQHSGKSAMVFLPFRVRAGRFYSPFGWEIGPVLPRLPSVALVLAAEDVDLDADPDHSEPDPETPPAPEAAPGAT